MKSGANGTNDDGVNSVRCDWTELEMDDPILIFTVGCIQIGGRCRHLGADPERWERAVGAALRRPGVLDEEAAPICSRGR